MRSGAGQRARFLRALLSRLSVRDLGRKVGARGHGLGDVRDFGRGLGGPFRAFACTHSRLIGIWHGPTKAASIARAPALIGLWPCARQTTVQKQAIEI